MAREKCSGGASPSLSKNPKFEPLVASKELFGPKLLNSTLSAVAGAATRHATAVHARSFFTPMSHLP
jgi:hypothetical protein